MSFRLSGGDLIITLFIIYLLSIYFRKIELFVPEQKEFVS